MMQGKRSVTVLALTCLILTGFSANGYSQQRSDTLQNPEGQEFPKIQQPNLEWLRRHVAGLQVIADLSVSPLAYTGSCPAVFTFKGRIYANKATPVQYKFIRSDGVYSNTETLVFEKEGRQEVTYTWQVGEAAMSSSTFTGAVVLEVAYPGYMKIQSEKAVIRGTCTVQGMPGPQNRPGQQTTTATQDLFPQPTGQQGQRAGQDLFPQPTVPKGQPAVGDGDCVSFNPATTNVHQNLGNWSIVDGTQTLFDFGFKKIEAENALAIIKHYGMDQSCFVGHPRRSFHYMLAGGSSPVGPFPGEDCRSFNPATTYPLWIKGWKVVEGNNALFDFDADRSGADQALAIIRRYGFTRSCLMAKGKVDFLYLRK